MFPHSLKTCWFTFVSLITVCSASVLKGAILSVFTHTHIPTHTGAVHKVLHARGGRGSEVGQFVAEGGQEQVTSHCKKFIHMKPKIESDV